MDCRQKAGYGKNTNRWHNQDMKRSRRYIRWTFCLKKKQEDLPWQFMQMKSSVLLRCRPKNTTYQMKVDAYGMLLHTYYGGKDGQF